MRITPKRIILESLVLYAFLRIHQASCIHQHLVYTKNLTLLILIKYRRKMHFLRLTPSFVLFFTHKIRLILFINSIQNIAMIVICHNKMFKHKINTKIIRKRNCNVSPLFGLKCVLSYLTIQYNVYSGFPYFMTLRIV